MFFGLATVTTFIENSDLKWFLLFTWIAGSIFIYFQTAKIKRIEFDGENFQVSNYLRSETIHKSRVIAVSSLRVLGRREMVLLELNENTSFGKTLLFMPQNKRFKWTSQHPVFKELRTACNL